MKNIRYLLYGALILISLTLFNEWQREHAPVVQANAQQSQATLTANSGAINNNPQQINNLANQNIAAAPEERLVSVKTDLLDAKIDTLGGNIVYAALLKYPLTLRSDKPFVLLNDQPGKLYIVQSGLTKSNVVGEQPELTQYRATQKSYTFKSGEQKLVVTLDGKKDGLAIQKTYTFYPNKYSIDVAYNITNRSKHSWNGNYYMQIVHDVDAPKSGGLLSGSMSVFNGIAFYNPLQKYQQVKASNLQESPLNQNVRGGWIATPQHYFLAAWVPDTEANYHYYSQVTASAMYTVGMIGHQLAIEPQNTAQLSSTLYTGPKIAKYMDAVAPLLSRTIDFGWMWFIAIIIFKALAFVNKYIGNWGWSIIIITILIKLVFYKLSETSYVSMARMRELQPKLKALKDRLGDNKEAMSRETMELYKKEGINPLGGCLPIVVQIPVFIALYYVLLESVELRQAPFMFWIHDLAIKDPFYILPILMGLTMYFQQKLSPQPPDPTQAKIMMFLPVFMTVIFLNFPAGLVLYWFVNNLLSILQQWYVTKRIENGTYARKRQRAKR